MGLIYITEKDLARAREEDKMREYLKNQIRERDLKAMTCLTYTLTSYLVVVILALVLLMLSAVVWFPEWGKSASKFLFGEGWIFPNAVWISVVLLIGAGIVCIPYFIKEKRLSRLKKQLKELEAKGG